MLWLLIHVMAALGHPLLALPGAPASRWVQTLLLVDFLIRDRTSSRSLHPGAPPNLFGIRFFLLRPRILHGG